jgi:signal transduction histidine kinase
VNTFSTIRSKFTPVRVTGIYARVIPLMRLMLALSGLLIFELNSPDYSSKFAFDFDILTLYFVCAYCIYAALHCLFPDAMLKVFKLEWLHWIDLTWYLALNCLNGGVDSPFFSFFIFAILVASFRYGFAEGLRVTLACTLLSILSHGLLGYYSLLPYSAENPVYLSAVNSMSLLILGYLIANWGGIEMLQKRQLKLLSEINCMPNKHLSAEQVMGSSIEMMREFYGAQTCLAIMKMPDAAYVMFKAENDANKSIKLIQTLDSNLAANLLGLPALWSISYVNSAKWQIYTPTADFSQLDYSETDNSYQKISQCGEAIAHSLEADSFASVPMSLHGEDIGRLYLTNCNTKVSAADIIFLQQLVNQIIPHIENIQLLEKIAVTATSSMRQQISLDLHDTTIQPYIGLKLGLEALRRKIPEGDSIAEELDDLVYMTGEGIAELRQYISSLKERLEKPLMPAIQQVAEKYHYHHGIKVKVHGDSTLKISDKVAVEIHQIVCEALSNVHRHTTSKEVTINLYYCLQLLILQVINHGDKIQKFTAFKPRSITERVTNLGGIVKIDHQVNGTTTITAEIPFQHKETLHAKY